MYYIQLWICQVLFSDYEYMHGTDSSSIAFTITEYGIPMHHIIMTSFIEGIFSGIYFLSKNSYSRYNVIHAIHSCHVDNIICRNMSSYVFHNSYVSVFPIPAQYELLFPALPWPMICYIEYLSSPYKESKHGLRIWIVLLQNWIFQWQWFISLLQVTGIEI